MRVMLDTNILVSLIFFPSAVTRDFARRVGFGNRIVLCDYVVEELKKIVAEKYAAKAAWAKANPELAAKLEITDKAISKWERGISCPDISLLIPLARILGVTTSELLNGEKCAAPEKSKDVLVEETLLYSDRSAAQKADRMKGILFTFFSSSVMPLPSSWGSSRCPYGISFLRSERSALPS